MIEPTPAPTCAVCNKPRKPRGAYKEQAELDPFCSTECCQSYFGITNTTIGEKKELAVNGAKAPSGADTGDVYRARQVVA